MLRRTHRQANLETVEVPAEVPAEGAELVVVEAVVEAAAKMPRLIRSQAFERKKR